MRTIILPVIHQRDVDTTRRNARIAFENGCTGLFLIPRGGADEELAGPAVELKQQYPDRLVGVNRLASSPALAVASGITPETPRN